MNTEAHSYHLDRGTVYAPRPTLNVSRIAVAGFMLEVVEDGYSKRHEWELREGGRLIDSGHGSRHSVALELGTSRLLGCLRRAGAVAAAARIKRSMS